MPILWLETMSSGNPDIDRDHKALVDLVNEMERAIEVGAPLAPLLTRLREEAAGHFVREEAIQQARRFPLTRAHRSEHEDLLAQLDGLLERYVVERTAPLDAAAAVDILHFITVWVSDHIILDDLRMTPYVAEV